MLTNYEFTDTDIEKVYRSSCKRPDTPKGGTKFKMFQPDASEDIQLRLNVLEYYRERFRDSNNPECFRIALTIGNTMLKLKPLAGLFIPDADAGKAALQGVIPATLRDTVKGFEALLRGKRFPKSMEYIFGR